MTPTKNLQTLAAGMDRAMADKSRILPLVSPGRICEVGCGSGSVLHLLSGAFPDSEITGLDIDPAMVEMASHRGYPNLNVTVAVADAGDYAGWPGGFDTLILCSCLHEAIQADLLPEERQREGVKMVADMARRLLRPGGRVIVRDGVRPQDAYLRLRFWNRDVADMLKWFVEDYRPFHPAVTWLPNGEALLSSAAAFEFLTKYTYRDNWYQEMGEAYGWATLDGLTEGLRGEGLEIVAADSYAVPFLADLWREDVYLRPAYDEGAPITLDSTMLVAATV